MTDENSQLVLQESAAALIQCLRECQGAMRHSNDTEHLQHREFARRARLLALYLSQALQAAAATAYPAAFALLRSAIDHRLFDRLLFLGSLHEVVVPGVTDDTWTRWQTRPPAHLHSWERLSHERVRIVWRGPQVVDAEGRPLHGLSIYYKWWKDYDPFAVPARDLGQIATGHPSRREQMAAYSDTQRELWSEALAWRNLKANLRLNGLASDREVLQLDVHHRFLSAFTHPFSEQVTDSIYRHRFQGDWPTEEHYAQELVLLYVCAFAIDELRDFERMTRREPLVDLVGWDAVERELEAGEARIAHLWPPGRPPHLYDRVHEANQRVFDAYDEQRAAGKTLTRPDIPDPRQLSDDEIRYYADPLRRLARLHDSSTEMVTGLTWQSPWPLADARFR